MGLFKNAQNQPQLSEREKLQGKFNSCRGTLLSVVLFTAINIVLLVTNTNSYFLFSAFIPYLIVDFAMAVCGKYPADYYEGSLSEYQFLDDSVLVVAVVIAAVLVGLYLLSWLLSKKPRVGWLIFALVFFALDTVLMLLIGGEAFTTIIDIVFHGWALFSLIGGIRAYYKLKKLPEEEPATVLEEVPVEEPAAVLEEQN